MKRKKSTTYLVDACVLIDYFKVDLSVLGLFAKHFGPVYACLDIVVEEVDGLDIPTCYNANISIYESNLDQLEAAAHQRGQLSFYDHLFFLVARDKKWTAITNDENLLDACHGTNIDTSRGIRPLIDLTKAGHITSRESTQIAKQIVSNNAQMSRHILQEFKRAIRD
ncbi:MAG: hypothetical protein JRF33_21825 [Deltaproteobacteria bacterium]|nr:hypothetical protein [Deltaproteobacteria bacterium]